MEQLPNHKTMLVYRITTKKWAKNLRGSGFSACWNSNGVFIAYTASSRALACLEMVVHQRSEALASLYNVTVAEIPDDISIKVLDITQLSKNWHENNSYTECQKLGDAWIESQESCVLKVPSAIINAERRPNEFNYLINPQHQDFSKIQIIDIEDFIFDNRIKK